MINDQWRCDHELIKENLCIKHHLSHLHLNWSWRHMIHLDEMLLQLGVRSSDSNSGWTLCFGLISSCSWFLWKHWWMWPAWFSAPAHHLQLITSMLITSMLMKQKRRCAAGFILKTEMSVGLFWSCCWSFHVRFHSLLLYKLNLNQTFTFSEPVGAKKISWKCLISEKRQPVLPVNGGLTIKD